MLYEVITETTTGQAFSEGIKILVQAKIEYHPVYGLSLNIRDIDPAYTMGDMAPATRPATPATRML